MISQMEPRLEIEGATTTVGGVGTVGEHGPVGQLPRVSTTAVLRTC